MQSMAILTSIRYLPFPAGRPRAGHCTKSGLLLALGLEDLLAPVISVGADVMPQVHFAGGRLERQRRIGQRIVRAVHAALRGRLPVLLYCHDYRSLLFNDSVVSTRPAFRKPRSPPGPSARLRPGGTLPPRASASKAVRG